MSNNSKRTFAQLPANGQRIVVWIDKTPYGGAFSEEDSAVEFTDYHFMDVDKLIELGAEWITEDEGNERMRRVLGGNSVEEDDNQ